MTPAANARVGTEAFAVIHATGKMRHVRRWAAFSFDAQNIEAFAIGILTARLSYGDLRGTFPKYAIEKV